MMIKTLFKGAIALLAAVWMQASAAEETAGAQETAQAYVSEAVSTVAKIYESDLDAQERSTLISQSGLNEYWLTSRQTTIAGKGSGAAFATLLGFRPDSWAMGEFRQAGDFGEIAAEFSRTKTFRSGEQQTTTKNLVYEMVKSGDGWAIASFRVVEPEATESDKQVSAWEEESAAVTLPKDGASPVDVVQAQLDMLKGLPPQALRNASEKSADLWQDTREARQGQGRVVSIVSAMAGFSAEPLGWTLKLEKEGVSSATVKAQVVTDAPMAFSGLLFSLEKTDNHWLLSAATATR